MAQYHYVVAFDSETKKWSCENDAGLLDGNVWSEDEQHFTWPNDEDIPNSELIDQRCKNMLNALVPIWPEVDTTEYK